MKPLEERFKNREYKPTINVPRSEQFADDDLEWKNIHDSYDNSVHSCLIPSANKMLWHGPKLPDLDIRLISCPDMIPGMMLKQRNQPPFTPKNIQKVDRVCKMLPFGRNNFIFPATEPDMALYGWYNNCTHLIFPNENLNNGNEVMELLEDMKKKNMISHDEVAEIKFEYYAVNQWAHQANIIFQFENPVKFMN